MSEKHVCSNCGKELEGRIARCNKCGEVFCSWECADFHLKKCPKEKVDAATQHAN
jgi:hypothetical protein